MQRIALMSILAKKGNDMKPFYVLTVLLSLFLLSYESENLEDSRLITFRNSLQREIFGIQN